MVNQTRYEHSLIILPDRIIENWETANLRATYGGALRVRALVAARNSIVWNRSRRCAFLTLRLTKALISLKNWRGGNGYQRRLPHLQHTDSRRTACGGSTAYLAECLHAPCTTHALCLPCRLRRASKRINAAAWASMSSHSLRFIFYLLPATRNEFPLSPSRGRALRTGYSLAASATSNSVRTRSRQLSTHAGRSSGSMGRDMNIP